MAHFELGAGRVSRPVAHHCVDEIWYILHGRGEMWRRQGDRQETVPLAAGTCLTIPAGTHFPVPVIPGWSPDGRSRDDAAVAWPWRGLPGQREVGDRSAVSRQRWDNPVQLPGTARTGRPDASPTGRLCCPPIAHDRRCRSWPAQPQPVGLLPPGRRQIRAFAWRWLRACRVVGNPHFRRTGSLGWRRFPGVRGRGVASKRPIGTRPGDGQKGGQHVCAGDPGPCVRRRAGARAA